MSETHTLFSLLGAPPRGEGYRSVRYRFPDAVRESTFFAFALLDHLRAHGEGDAPGRLVVLGTTGSHWGLLAGHAAAAVSPDLAGPLRAEEARLGEDARHDRVDQGRLDRLAGALEAALGMACRLRLIPYALAPDEQTAVLHRIGAEVKPGSRVSFDVTHGLRHLPMLGLMSALYVSRVRRARVEGVWYGAADRIIGGTAAVTRLDGLLRLAEWTAALHSFERDGDVRVFVDPLRTDGADPAMLDALDRCGHFERLHRLDLARTDAIRALDRLDRNPPPGIGALFEDVVRDELLWVEVGTDHRPRQRALAFAHLDRGDSLRATLLGYEAFISDLVAEQHPAADDVPGLMDHGTRERVKERFDHPPGGMARDPRWPAFAELRMLRNSLAHTSDPLPGREADFRIWHTRMKQALASPAAMAAHLRRLFATLFPGHGAGNAPAPSK